MAMVLLETIKNSKYGKAAAVAAVIVPVIIAFEGLKQSPYQAPEGKLTVCYGETNKVQNRTYSVQECRQMLTETTSTFVTDMLSTSCFKNVESMPESVLAALVSFSYNTGPNAHCSAENPNLANAIRSQNWESVCAQLSKFIYHDETITDANGKKVKTGKKVKSEGLIKRRAAEQIICFKDLGVTVAKPADLRENLWQEAKSIASTYYSATNYTDQEAQQYANRTNQKVYSADQIIYSSGDFASNIQNAFAYTDTNSLANNVLSFTSPMVLGSPFSSQQINGYSPYNLNTPPSGGGKNLFDLSDSYNGFGDSVGAGYKVQAKNKSNDNLYAYSLMMGASAYTRAEMGQYAKAYLGKVGENLNSNSLNCLTNLMNIKLALEGFLINPTVLLTQAINKALQQVCNIAISKINEVNAMITNSINQQLNITASQLGIPQEVFNYIDTNFIGTKGLIQTGGGNGGINYDTSTNKEEKYLQNKEEDKKGTTEKTNPFDTQQEKQQITGTTSNSNTETDTQNNSNQEDANFWFGPKN